MQILRNQYTVWKKKHKKILQTDTITVRLRNPSVTVDLWMWNCLVRVACLFNCWKCQQTTRNTDVDHVCVCVSLEIVILTASWQSRHQIASWRQSSDPPSMGNWARLFHSSHSRCLLHWQVPIGWRWSPESSHSCKTIDTRPVCCMVCLFTSWHQIILLGDMLCKL